MNQTDAVVDARQGSFEDPPVNVGIHLPSLAWRGPDRRRAVAYGFLNRSSLSSPFAKGSSVRHPLQLAMAALSLPREMSEVAPTATNVMETRNFRNFKPVHRNETVR